MATIERVYVIPLRREFLKTPRWRRAKKAVATVRAYLLKHTKMETVKLGRWLNETVWGKGARHPPGKITVKVIIDKEKKLASAEMATLPKKAIKVQKKLDEKKKKENKKKKAEKAEEAKETKAEEVKTEEEQKKIESKKHSKPSKEQERFMST